MEAEGVPQQGMSKEEMVRGCQRGDKKQSVPWDCTRSQQT